MPAETCPTQSQLEHLVLGKLAEKDLNTVARHVDDCVVCQGSLKQLEQQVCSPLGAQLKTAAAEDAFSGEAQFGEALNRVKALAERLAIVETGKRGDSVAVGDPSELHHYRIVKKLGAGGMGTVYKALHTKLDKVVALKVLLADRVRDAHAVERFQREMKAVGRLEHANIVGASDAGEADGRHFLVMQYVAGIDLSALVQKVGPLPVAEACALVRQAADGLQFVHENGMVHRDIKPSNLMLTGNGQIKILDLGLALLNDHPAESKQDHAAVPVPADSQLTAAGQLMGTLDYMAPEQCDDSHQVDIRADIYSLGATLYKLIAGRPPFDDVHHDTPMKKMIALTGAAPTPIRELRPEVPELLSQVIHRMLAKLPAHRFDMPARVVTALTPFAESADVPGWLAGALETDLDDLRPDSLLSVDSAETIMSDSQKKTDAQFDPYHVWLSIAPDEQPPHHYRLLGLKPFESDLRVIESAADRQMAHVRTFQSGKYSKESQKLLNEISSAKLFLLNDAKKRAYDDKLQAELAAADREKQAAAQPAARPAAKPAPKTAKRIAVQPDAPSASEFTFTKPAPSVSVAAQSRKSPNWALIASAAAVLLLVGIVGFVAMRDDDPALAQHEQPTVPPVTVGEEQIAKHQSDDNVPNSQPPPKQSTTSKSTGGESGSETSDTAQSSGNANDPLPPTLPAKDDTPPDASGGNDSDVPVPSETQLPRDMPQPPTADEVAPVEKNEVPGEAEVQAAFELVGDLFRKRIAAAETAEAKVKVARELLTTAADNREQPAQQYALISEAGKLAVAAADTSTMADAIAALDDDFKIDGIARHAAALEIASRGTLPSANAQELAAAMADLMQRAAETDRFDIVETLSDALKKKLLRRVPSDSRTKLLAVLNQSEEMEKAFQAAERAKAKLSDDDKTNDADAHLALGEYLCFVKGDWAQGLSHLAQGSDSDLKKLANKDIAHPMSAADQITLADAWWEHAENEKRDDATKIAQQARAAFWYEQASPSLSGLAQKKVQQRLDELTNSRGEERGEPLADNSKEELAAGAIRFVPRAKLTDHKTAIKKIAFAPGGTIVSCDSEAIRFWDAKTWKSTTVVDSDAHSTYLSTCALSTDGKTLVSVGYRPDSPIKMWDVATRQVRRELGKGNVRSIEFSPDGKTVAAAMVDQGTMLFDSAGGKRFINSSGLAYLGLAFSPDSQFIATAEGGGGGPVKVFSVATGQLIATLSQDGKAKGALCWSPRGKVIAMAAENDATLEVWDVATRKLIGTLQGHTDTVLALQFLPSAATPILATASRDKTVRIWNLAAGGQIASLPGHQDEVTSLAVSPDGTALATGDKQGVILVWEIRKAR